MATKKMTLDAWQAPLQTACAVQGEADARFLEVTLVSGGQPIDLTGRAVYLYMVKPDGAEIFNACTIDEAAEGKVTAELTAQMSAAAGEAKDVEFRVVGGSENTETLKIKGPKILFLPSDYDGAVESTPEYTALTQALADVQDFDSVKALAQNAIPASQKGAASGVATLDASGKLVQKPTPGEIGAVPTSALNQSVATLDSNGDLNQMPNANQVGAIPASQKGARGGVATLDSSGKLVQDAATIGGKHLLFGTWTGNASCTTEYGSLYMSDPLNISFGRTLPSVPMVMASFYTNGVTTAHLTSPAVSTSSFTIRLANAKSSDISVTVTWLAIY